jgi:hypothetical protein
MHKYAFAPEVDETYLPVNLEQFETLVNEIQGEFNKHMAPNSLDGEYMALVVHGAIHALDRTIAVVSKTDLLNRCINSVSKNLTFRAAQGIEAKMKAGQTPTEEPPTDNVVPIGQENN